jgi:hypothetical protein
MIRLEVPLIRQRLNNSCWNAALQMLYGFRKQSAVTLDETFEDNKGLSAKAFVDLAEKAGLRTLPTVTVTYSTSWIESMLRNVGPLWVAGYWDGAPHIIVVAGVDGEGKIIVNDPARDVPRHESMSWFNERIAKDIPIPIMYLP